jgi:hypothetical protein
MTVTDYRDRLETLTGISLRVCPACQHGEMIIVERANRSFRGCDRLRDLEGLASSEQGVRPVECSDDAPHSE